MGGDLEGTGGDGPTNNLRGLEPCADVIVSAAARRSNLVGGPTKLAAAARRGQPNVFSKIPEKISFYPNYLTTLLSF